MPKPNLSGPCRKLERALHHLHELGDAFASLDASARAQTRMAHEEIRDEPQGVVHLFRMGPLTPVPDAVPLIVGDYIQNLRSALDHLAYELVSSGTTPGAVSSTAVQFPIYRVGRSVDRNVKTFASQVGKNLPGVLPDQVALVNSYQPFHRGRWHLGTLATLSNQDKHRIITPTQRLAGQVDPTTIAATNGGRVISWTVLFKDGQAVNSLTPLLEVVVDKKDADVIMHTNFKTPLAFQERPGHHHRTTGLLEIGEVVSEIVAEVGRRWGRAADATRAELWSTAARADLGL